MSDFDQYISDLLYEHDCVIVPNFGGFVGNKMPSTYQKTTHHLQPPFKQISFNQSLKRNDGLLISYLAEKENKTYQQAQSEVTKFSDNVHHQLQENREVVIEKVGTLYYDSNKKLRFQQDYSVNYLKSAFGFSAIQMVPIDRKEVIVEEKIIRLNKGKSKSRSRRGSGLLYAAAVFPIIAYLCWLPLKTDILKGNGNFHYSDLNPFSDKVCSVYSQRVSGISMLQNKEDNEPYSWLSSKEELVNVSFLKNEKSKPIVVRLKDKPVVAESTHVEVIRPFLNLRYHIVGGCFSRISNAKRFVKKLSRKGYKSHIVDNHNGLNRVSIESYATREEAIDKLQSVRNKVNNNAWLLVK